MCIGGGGHFNIGHASPACIGPVWHPAHSQQPAVGQSMPPKSACTHSPGHTSRTRTGTHVRMNCTRTHTCRRRTRSSGAMALSLSALTASFSWRRRCFTFSRSRAQPEASEASRALMCAVSSWLKWLASARCDVQSGRGWCGLHRVSCNRVVCRCLQRHHCSSLARIWLSEQLCTLC